MKDQIRKALEKKYTSEEIADLEKTLSPKEIEKLVQPPKWFIAILLVLLISLGYWIYPSDSSNQTPERKLTKKEIHDKNISMAFNPWDGSHRNLEILIKKSLNDPNSYNHLETTYRDLDSILIITSEFTAKNGFGGTIREGVVVSADTLGNIIDVVKWIDD
jgi:hypothetical protein